MQLQDRFVRTGLANLTSITMPLCSSPSPFAPVTKKIPEYCDQHDRTARLFFVLMTYEVPFLLNSIQASWRLPSMHRCRDPAEWFVLCSSRPGSEESNIRYPIVAVPSSPGSPLLNEFQRLGKIVHARNQDLSRFACVGDGSCRPDRVARVAAQKATQIGMPLQGFFSQGDRLSQIVVVRLRKNDFDFAIFRQRLSKSFDASHVLWSRRASRQNGHLALPTHLFRQVFRKIVPVRGVVMPADKGILGSGKSIERQDVNLSLQSLVQ
jgi:hypothetical protein